MNARILLPALFIIAAPGTTFAQDVSTNPLREAYFGNLHVHTACGANLDRIQIIKGWIENGEQKEQIYDVALSGDRTDGSEPVGNTVDGAAASYTNDIGATELMATWTDPEFDPAQRAFYYVRVIEIPSPRWTTIDAKVFGVKRPEDVPAFIQERAYTSPIWYSPAG